MTRKKNERIHKFGAEKRSVTNNRKIGQFEPHDGMDFFGLNWRVTYLVVKTGTQIFLICENFF